MNRDAVAYTQRLGADVPPPSFQALKAFHCFWITGLETQHLAVVCDGILATPASLLCLGHVQVSDRVIRFERQRSLQGRNRLFDSIQHKPDPGS